MLLTSIPQPLLYGIRAGPVVLDALRGNGAANAIPGTFGGGLANLLACCPLMGTCLRLRDVLHAPTVVVVKRTGMRITHSDGEHLVVLSDAEASMLVDAAALLVIASHSVPDATLPPEMAAVLGQLFEGLKAPSAETGAIDQSHCATRDLEP